MAPLKKTETQDIPDTPSIADLFLSPTIRVIVGPEKTVYHLHQETLKARSPYFAQLLSFGGTEVTENSVTLLDPIQPDAFKAFIEFIYTGNYQLPKISDPLDRAKDCFLLARIYVLADMMCMDDLKAIALESTKDLLMEKGLLDIRFFTQVVEYVYENTTDRYESGKGKAPRDGLRGVVSARCCSNIETWVTSSEFLKMVIRNGEFAVDMLCQLKNDHTALDGILAARRQQKATK